MNRSVLLWAGVVLFVVATGIGQNASAESENAMGTWEWSITPYVWLADTSFELRADSRDIGTGTVDFGELADKLNGAFQIIAETGRGRWSGFVDFTYLSMSDNQPIELPVLGSLQVATDSEQSYVDAAVAYWPWKEVSGFNMYAGVRHTDLDDRIRVQLVNPAMNPGVIGIDRSFTDALIGMRDRFKLVENWALIIRADYGFGDSEGVFLAQAALRWAVGPKRRQGIVLGYRYKDAEFKHDGREEQYKYKGPALGFNFRF